MIVVTSPDVARTAVARRVDDSASPACFTDDRARTRRRRRRASRHSSTRAAIRADASGTASRPPRRASSSRSWIWFTHFFPRLAKSLRSINSTPSPEPGRRRRRRFALLHSLPSPSFVRCDGTLGTLTSGLNPARSPALLPMQRRIMMPGGPALAMRIQTSPRLVMA